MTPTSPDLKERLRRTLGSIQTDDMGGDNLAITLASDFETRCESEELDDSGTWKQEALDKTDRLLDAIHDHYGPAFAHIDALEAELREAQESKARHVRALKAAEADNARLSALVDEVVAGLEPFAAIATEKYPGETHTSPLYRIEGETGTGELHLSSPFSGRSNEVTLWASDFVAARALLTRANGAGHD